jgi:hypothetical protein
MVISMVLDFGFWMVKFEISNKNLIIKVGRFQSTMGKQPFFLQ